MTKSMRWVAVIGLTVLLGSLVAVRLLRAADEDPVAAAAQQVDSKLWDYQTKDARAAIDPLAAKADTDARVALALGRVLDQEGKDSDALARLQKAAVLAPSDPAPMIYLGELYLREKKQSDADAAFTKAATLAQAMVTADPTNATALYELGVSQQRLRQYDNAVDSLQKALALNPDSAITLYQLGATRAFQQKWADAVDLLTKAIAKDSGLAYAYYYRGMAQDKLGKKDQLVLDMTRFLTIAPNAPYAPSAQAIVKAAKR